MSQPNNNNGDDDKRYKKIFVGGLAWSVTTDVLRSFFQEKCGEVLEANVVSETLPDGNLKSKGYGFVSIFFSLLYNLCVLVICGDNCLIYTRRKKLFV